jgi:hypothetical protein
MNEIILLATDRTDLRVTRSYFRGVDRVDIRTYMDIDGERRPTKKGVSIAREWLPDLITALLALEVRASPASSGRAPEAKSGQEG